MVVCSLVDEWEFTAYWMSGSVGVRVVLWSHACALFVCLVRVTLCLLQTWLFKYKYIHE